jgi:glycosyltransferase involved in cell wall biosynthesis
MEDREKCDRVPLTFVVPVNDRAILEKNLLLSPGLKRPDGPRLLVQEGFRSAAAAYNNAIDKATNDFVIFVHQDVYLPESWLSDLQIALGFMDQIDPAWGVLGCWGITERGQARGFLYTTDQGVIGDSFKEPVPVQTLDEVVLVLRRSSGLRFDMGLQGWHFYGTDICMTAASQGMKSYAISAFCVHNTKDLTLALPKSFYQCYRHVKRRWRQYLPIHTSCTTISRFDWEIRQYRLKQYCFGIVGVTRGGASRVDDPIKVFEELRSLGALDGGRTRATDIPLDAGSTEIR